MCAKVGEDPIKVRERLAETCKAVNGDTRVHVEANFLTKCNNAVDAYSEGTKLLTKLVKENGKTPKTCKPKANKKCSEIDELYTELTTIRTTVERMSGISRFGKVKQLGRMLIKAESASQGISEKVEAERSKHKEPVKFDFAQHLNIGPAITTAQFVLGRSARPDKEYELADLAQIPEEFYDRYEGMVEDGGKIYFISRLSEENGRRSLHELTAGTVGESFVKLCGFFRSHIDGEKRFRTFDSGYDLLEFYKNRAEQGTLINFDALLKTDELLVISPDDREALSIALN